MKKIKKINDQSLSHKLSISEVAAEVGYNSIQSFRRAFKKVMKINPSELKNKYT